MSTLSLAQNRVAVAEGVLEGAFEEGVRSFRGIPFAKAPVGELRWRPPQLPDRWEGVRKANRFGPRAMQRPIFGDMDFRSNGMSEDCLYLNVWTSAVSERERLPVLVYFYGGGFQAGDGSEGRYDGASMARRGLVVVTVNYRLNVFGFLAHPALTAESPQPASGNYGLLDQHAALGWVQTNIGRFGGDAAQVTIAGESAGSISVSAHMASPISGGLFARAIGESGSLLGALTPVARVEAEQAGLKFAADHGARSLPELRAMPAEKLLEACGQPGTPWFGLTVDGYFFPKDPLEVYAAGEQAAVPLLAGWNSEEMDFRMVLGGAEPTLANFRAALQRLYPDHWEEAWKVYGPANPDGVVAAATDLAGDRFMGYSTWKWLDSQSRVGGGQTYRYFYTRPRPPMRPEMGNARPGLAGGVVRDPGADSKPAPAQGAVHSAEIEYALGNLENNRVYAWTNEDFQVSATLQSFFANFIKTGDPNGPGLPVWPGFNRDGVGWLMRIDVASRAETETRAERYRFLDRLGLR